MSPAPRRDVVDRLPSLRVGRLPVVSRAEPNGTDDSRLLAVTADGASGSGASGGGAPGRPDGIGGGGSVATPAGVADFTGVAAVAATGEDGASPHTSQ